MVKFIKGGLWAKKKLIIAGVLIAVAFLGYRHFVSSNGEVAESQVKRGDVVETIVLTGEVRAVELANLHFNAPGTLAWVGVSLGDTVSRGQALMQLNTTRLNAAYQVSRLRLAEAEAALDAVYDSLQGKETTATFAEISTRVSAEAAKNIAYENMIAAQRDLADATLRAPFAGIVSFMATEVSGANVLAGATQVTVVNPETIYFEVSADQTEVTKLKEGQEAIIYLDSFADTQIKGKVESISQTPSQSDFGTVYKVRVELVLDEAHDEQIRVGMTGDASFVVARAQNALYIPLSFLGRDSDGNYVNLGSPANKVYVEVGAMGEDIVEITGNISEGDTIYD